jgi:TfoX/Sxy family transcriptional regulator of competence genes
MAHESFTEYFFPLVRALCGVEGGAEHHAAGQALVDRGFVLGVATTDRFYLRTDAATRAELGLNDAAVLQSAGGETFETYREVPMEIVDQPTELRRWLNEARNVAGKERDGQ